MGPTMDNTTIVPPLIQIYTMGETYESKSEEKTVLEIYNPILVQEQQKEKTENILSKKVGQQTEGP